MLGELGNENENKAEMVAREEKRSSPLYTNEWVTLAPCIVLRFQPPIVLSWAFEATYHQRKALVLSCITQTQDLKLLVSYQQALYTRDVAPRPVYSVEISAEISAPEKQTVLSQDSTARFPIEPTALYGLLVQCLLEL